jgi:hypothetical protein
MYFGAPMASCMWVPPSICESGSHIMKRTRFLPPCTVFQSYLEYYEACRSEANAREGVEDSIRPCLRPRRRSSGREMPSMGSVGIASRPRLGLKSDFPVACSVVCNHHAAFIRPVCSCRAPPDEFQDLCAHALGRDPHRSGPYPLRLLLRYVLSVSARAALDHAHPRFYLFGQYFLEHQRHFSQLHSQSLFPIGTAESLVQHHGINHCRV